MGELKHFYTPAEDLARAQHAAYLTLKHGPIPTHVLAPWRGAEEIAREYNGMRVASGMRPARIFPVLLSSYDEQENHRKQVEFLGRETLERRVGKSLEEHIETNSEPPIIGIFEDLIDHYGSLGVLIPWVKHTFPGIRRIVVVGQDKDRDIEGRVYPNVCVEHVNHWSVFAQELWKHMPDELQAGKPWAYNAVLGTPTLGEDPYMQATIDGFLLGRMMWEDGFRPSHAFTPWPQSARAGILASESLGYLRRIIDGKPQGTRPWPVEVLANGEVIGIEHVNLKEGARVAIIDAEYDAPRAMKIIGALANKYGLLDVRTAAVHAEGVQPRYLLPKVWTPGQLVHSL